MKERSKLLFDSGREVLLTLQISQGTTKATTTTTIDRRGIDSRLFEGVWRSPRMLPVLEMA
eukprot:scaffold3299_cov198-Ochromonas_danica.AAC.2